MTPAVATQAPVSPIQSTTPSQLATTSLQTARDKGDPLADELVKLILNSEGAAGYNHIIDLMNQLSQSPDLLAIPSSNLATQLQTYPEPLLNYFSPEEAPDWVCPEKLALASEIWHENKLAIIGILYAASLPYCYLSHRGIPALYATEKLRNANYIFQRIYETGLFLEAVLSEGGLRLVLDIPEHSHSTESSHAGRDVSAPLPKRYLAGKGYLTAKKVRFLHATMRYMLTHNPSEGAPGWNQQAYGTPINQEDLAYTLLTFSYTIPQGLDRWGCFLNAEQCEAFLHLWRVVGYTIGLEADLLPQNWSEAKTLFESIRAKQDQDINNDVRIPFDNSDTILAEELAQGKILTDTLIGFLQKYLPAIWGLRRSLPPLLIVKQLGQEQADKILNPEHQAALKSWPSRIILHGGLRVLHLYYAAQQFFFNRMPILRTSMSNLFSHAGDALIESWRDDYQRRPFYIPKSLNSWQRQAGADQPMFQDALQNWRCNLFNVVGSGIVCLIAALLFLVLGVSASVAWVLDNLIETASHFWSMSCYVGIGILFAGGVLTLAYDLPAKLRKSENLDYPLPHSKLTDLAWASFFFLCGLVLVFERLFHETLSFKTLLWALTPFAGLSALTFAGGMWLLVVHLGKVIGKRPTPEQETPTPS